MNLYELYLEHVFQWQRYPDIAPPEALTPAEARELFDCAARYHMDVHPFMQTFGHFYNIGTKPPYRKFMVEDGGTVDIRKPEAVASSPTRSTSALLSGQVPQRDITERNDATFQLRTTQAELNEDFQRAQDPRDRGTDAPDDRQAQLGARPPGRLGP
jgi:hypothetical protein